jgi:WD40 repeat protein
MHNFHVDPFAAQFFGLGGQICDHLIAVECGDNASPRGRSSSSGGSLTVVELAMRAWREGQVGVSSAHGTTPANIEPSPIGGVSTTHRATSAKLIAAVPKQPHHEVMTWAAKWAEPLAARTRPAERAYDAFISYSHAADGTLAPAVQRGLEALAKPLYQRRALRVFRDQTSLAVTPALWPTIQQALEESKYFILFASPSAAQSPWVQQELAWWIEHREPETLLIALTAGTIVWDQASGDFAWGVTDALPNGLSGCFRQEPLWVDLRWAHEQTRLSHRNPGLQDAVASLAAPLRGMPKDDLVGRDLVLHRRAVRLTQAAVALLVLLALAATGGALVAVNQRNAARRQTLLAESGALVNAAAITAPTGLDTSLLLAERALRMHPSPETRAALFAALTASPHLVRFVHQPSAVSTLANLPGGGVALGHGDGSVSLLDAHYRNERTLEGAGTTAVTALAVSASADLLVAADRQGTVRLWSLASGKLRWQQRAGPSEATASGIAPDGLTVATATLSNALVVLDVRNGRVRDDVPLDLPGSAVKNLVFLDNRRVLVGDQVGRAQVWDVGTQLRQLSGHDQLSLGDELLANAWSEDGRTYAFTMSTRRASVFDAETGRQRGPDFLSAPPTAGPMAVSNRGDRAAFLYRGSLAMLDNSPEAEPVGRSRVELPGFARAELLRFSPDGRWLLAAGAATVAIFDLQQWARLVTDLPTELGPLPCRACVTSLAVDPLGRSLAWTDGPRVVCWDLRNNREGSVVHRPYGAWGVAFTSDGSMLVVSTETGLSVSSTPTGCPTSDLVSHVPSGAYSKLIPLGGSEVLAWDHRELPRLVDVRLGREVRTYGGQLGSSAFIGDVAVSSDTRTFAVTFNTGDIRWYDLDTGAEVGVAHADTGAAGALAFAPGSRRVARTTATSIQLWDPGRLVGQLDGSAQQLRFSADGQLLFGLDNEEVLRVWDVQSRTRFGTVQALPLVDERGNPTAGGAEHGLRTAMGSTPDGMLWFVAASARPVGWTFSLPTWKQLACSLADRSLSREEWTRYVRTTPPSDLSCPG